MCVDRKKPGSKIKLSVIVVTVGPIFGKLNIQGYNIMHNQYKGEKSIEPPLFLYNLKIEPYTEFVGYSTKY